MLRSVMRLLGINLLSFIQCIRGRFFIAVGTSASLYFFYFISAQIGRIMARKMYDNLKSFLRVEFCSERYCRILIGKIHDNRREILRSA